MRDSFRMQSVQSPIIPVVGELIRSHPGTISLGQGVAYYGPPPEAIEAIQRFLADPENHKYKLVQGIPELLEAIEQKLRTENDIVLDGRRIVVTAGANMGFVNAILAMTDPGDEIILQLPYYFNHEMAVAIADCKAVCVPTDDDYQLQPEAIAHAITDRTRAVVTISPNNPTGAVYRESDLRRVNEICRQHGIYHISDEAYEYFTYDGARHFSPGSITGSGEHTISLFSLSKAYGFASWRIGWMVIPEHLYMPVRKIQIVRADTSEQAPAACADDGRDLADHSVGEHVAQPAMNVAPPTGVIDGEANAVLCADLDHLFRRRSAMRHRLLADDPLSARFDDESCERKVRRCVGCDTDDVELLLVEHLLGVKIEPDILVFLRELVPPLLVSFGTIARVCAG